MPRRGKTADRDYGSGHQRTRAAWAPIVAAGGVDCWRCEQPITRGQPWHLGHADGSNRKVYRGPEHATCNTRAGAASRHEPQPRPRTRW